MKTKSISTRRRFFLQAGAAMSVPLAAGGHATESGTADSVEKARLAALEDERAIRDLQRAYARLFNSGAHEEIRGLFVNPTAAHIDGSVRGLSPVGFGEHDAVEISPDRKTATARTHCAVHTETAIGPSCTLVEMAREQGEGVLRQSEARVLVGRYARVAGAWKIDRLAWEPL
jgi:hypothetical protein